jgi:hypothetical protein
MSLTIDVFLQRIQKISDVDFRNALSSASGKADPFLEPDKYRNMKKRFGDIKLKPLLMKAFEIYFLFTATQPATKMSKNHVTRTLKDLELRMKFLPKAIDNLSHFKEAGITKKEVCMLACREYPYNHYYGPKQTVIDSKSKKNCDYCVKTY